MGVSVDCYVYDRVDIIRETSELTGIEDLKLIEFIYDKAGNFIGDKYVIMKNELWEDSNPYWEIDRVFSDISKCEFSIYDIKSKREEIVNGIDCYEILQDVKNDFDIEMGEFD